jgi:hypothetical protein
MNRDELKKRLRMKVKQQQVGRCTSTVRSQEMSKMYNNIIDEVKESITKQPAPTAVNKSKAKNNNKKLKAMEKKYGKISEDKYNETVIRYKTTDYKNESDKNHDKNIIALYLNQNKGSNSNANNNALENLSKLGNIADKMILDGDDESISSELSE